MSRGEPREARSAAPRVGALGSQLVAARGEAQSLPPLAWPVLERAGDG